MITDGWSPHLCFWLSNSVSYIKYNELVPAFNFSVSVLCSIIQTSLAFTFVLIDYPKYMGIYHECIPSGWALYILCHSKVMEIEKTLNFYCYEWRGEFYISLFLTHNHGQTISTWNHNLLKHSISFHNTTKLQHIHSSVLSNHTLYISDNLFNLLYM